MYACISEHNLKVIISVSFIFSLYMKPIEFNFLLTENIKFFGILIKSKQRIK